MSTVFFASLTGLVWMGLTSQIAWGTFAVGAILGPLLLLFGLKNGVVETMRNRLLLET